jgi:hypothetical protein
MYWCIFECIAQWQTHGMNNQICARVTDEWVAWRECVRPPGMGKQGLDYRFLISYCFLRYSSVFSSHLHAYTQDPRPLSGGHRDRLRDYVFLDMY